MGDYRDYRREFRQAKAAGLIDRCRALNMSTAPAASLHAALDELLDTAFTADDAEYEQELVSHAADLVERVAGHLDGEPALAKRVRDSFAAAVHYRVPFTTFYVPPPHQ